MARSKRTRASASSSSLATDEAPPIPNEKRSNRSTTSRSKGKSSKVESLKRARSPGTSPEQANKRITKDEEEEDNIKETPPLTLEPATIVPVIQPSPLLAKADNGAEATNGAQLTGKTGNETSYPVQPVALAPLPVPGAFSVAAIPPLVKLQPVPSEPKLETSALPEDQPSTQTSTLDKLRELENALLLRRKLLEDSLALKVRDRPPKCLVSGWRLRTHRDHMMEEVGWMATDFCEERRWKRVAASTSAIALKEYFFCRLKQVSERKEVFHATQRHMDILLAALENWEKSGEDSDALNYAQPAIALEEEKIMKRNSAAEPEVVTSSSSVPLGDAVVTTKAMNHTLEKARTVIVNEDQTSPETTALAPHQRRSVAWIDAMTKAITCAALAYHTEAGVVTVASAFLQLLIGRKRQSISSEEVKLEPPKQQESSRCVLFIAPACTLVQWQIELAYHAPSLAVACVGSADSSALSEANIVLAAPTFELDSDTRSILEKRGKYAAVVWDTRSVEGVVQLPSNVDECGWWQLSACSPALMHCPRRLLLVSEEIPSNASVLAWRAAWLCPNTFRSPTHTLRWVLGEMGEEARANKVVNALRKLVEPFHLIVRENDFEPVELSEEQSVMCELMPVQRLAYDQVVASEVVREALAGKHCSAAAAALTLIQHTCFFQTPEPAHENEEDDAHEEGESGSEETLSKNNKKKRTHGSIESSNGKIDKVGSGQKVLETAAVIEKPIEVDLAAGSGKLTKLSELIQSLGSKVMILAELPSTFQLIITFLKTRNISHESAVFIGSQACSNENSIELDLWNSCQRSICRFNRAKNIQTLVTTVDALNGFGSVVPLADDVLVLEGCWGHEIELFLTRMMKHSQRSACPVVTVHRFVAENTLESYFDSSDFNSLKGKMISSVLQEVNLTSSSSSNNGKKFLSKINIDTLLEKLGVARRGLWHCRPQMDHNPDSIEKECGTEENMEVVASLIENLKSSERGSDTDSQFLFYETAPILELSRRRASEDLTVPTSSALEVESSTTQLSIESGGGIEGQVSCDLDSRSLPDLIQRSHLPTHSQLSLFNFYAAMRELSDAGIRCDACLAVPLISDRPILKPSWLDADDQSTEQLCLAYMDRPRTKKLAIRPKKHSTVDSASSAAEKKKAALAEAENKANLETKERRNSIGHQRRAVDPRARLRQKEDMSLEMWQPSEDETLLSLMDVYYPNVALVSMILNLKPVTIGRRRSPRQCQDRYTELKTQKISITRSPPDDLCRLRSASPGLLYAPWPPLRAEEGATPSVLPISRVRDSDYVERRRRFSLLLQCEDSKVLELPTPTTSTQSVALVSNPSDGDPVQQLNEHPSHAQCIQDVKRNTEVGLSSSPIDIVNSLYPSQTAQHGLISTGLHHQRSLSAQPLCMKPTNGDGRLPHVVLPQQYSLQK